MVKKRLKICKGFDRENDSGCKVSINFRELHCSTENFQLSRIAGLTSETTY